MKFYAHTRGAHSSLHFHKLWKPKSFRSNQLLPSEQKGEVTFYVYRTVIRRQITQSPTPSWLGYMENTLKQMFHLQGASGYLEWVETKLNSKRLSLRITRPVEPSNKLFGA